MSFIEKEWYILIEFSSTVEKQVKLIQLLSDKTSNIYVRKDFFNYSEWKEEEKIEYINELYEEFIFDTLYIKQEAEEKMNKEIIEALKYQNFFNTAIEEINNIKQKLKNYSIKNTKKVETIIKTIIEKNIALCVEKEELFLEENKCFTNISNNSFRAYFSDGSLEDWNSTYDWYQIKNKESLEKFLLHNSTYNLIITKNGKDIKEFNYYLNQIENIHEVLAIQCKNERYKKVFIEKFQAEFSETDKIILYNKSIEI